MKRTPLVLVHGFMGGSAQWSALSPTLSDAYQLIEFDLPGFGRNNHLPVIDSIGGFADWVISEITAHGIERYHLLGHSMGGMIVQEMVHRDHDRIDRLVLYGTGAVGVLPGRFETIAQSKERAKADGAPQTARRIAATWFLHNHLAPAFESCAQIAELSSLEAIFAGLDAMQSWSGADHLVEIRQKTLLIWGDRDRTYPWSQTELLWTSIPHTNLAVVPGCAHAVHLENSVIFNQLVLDHLNLSDDR